MFLFALLLPARLQARDSSSAHAQSAKPVKLALISETSETSAAADVLTGQLSQNPNLQLLERSEIEKIYREQALSAGSRDYLKLGRVLGADGLVIMNVFRSKEATNLFVRVVDVKAGVILNDGSFPWPLKNLPEWAQSVAGYLELLSPRLSLAAGEAIPLSVVNFRFAMQSAGDQEMEEQLRMLAIQRLSREPQFFVLERQRMNLLGEEKELKLDDSAFWNGSYLLEGVVDQNGYSREKITINGRLTPPRGGAPLLIEVSGSRTNFAGLINLLALKFAAVLKVNPATSQWDAAAEAAKYFEEAGWALRWGMRREAQAAADSAWALGKRDMDCATVRIKACMVPASGGIYQFGDYTGYEHLEDVRSSIKREAGSDPVRNVVMIEQKWGRAKYAKYVFATKMPETEDLENACRALEFYYEFSRTLPPDEPKKNSAWYRLGVENLAAASHVLQQFHFVHESQAPAADKLARLRALARSVDEWIGKSPSVHDSYYIGDKYLSHDELGALMESPNLFKCEVQWGCFWQDRPEEGLALYRQLMSTAVFRYIHEDFWIRDLNQLRLCAWTDEDRSRTPGLWEGFMREMDGSSNLFWQLEAKAIRLAEASNNAELSGAASNLFGSMLEHRDLLTHNPAEVVYLSWGTRCLIGRSGLVTPAGEELENRFRKEYEPKFEEMDKEYWSKVLPAGKLLSKFEEQKRFLRENQPYNFFAFAKLFDIFDYSKGQALELLPLISAYRSNLMTQAETASGKKLVELKGAIAQVKFRENDLNRVLNAPATKPSPPVQTQAPKPVAPAKPAVASHAASNRPAETLTNILTVGKFLAIPLDGLPGDRTHQESSLQITAHHWQENRLVLDFQYSAAIYVSDNQGNWTQTRNATFPAIAILDPVQEHWEVVTCPEQIFFTKNGYYHRTALLQGQLFNCDGGEIRKYDSKQKKWVVLPVSDGGNYELFAIHGSLYAANQNVILEIVDDGKGTRIMASTRRQPPASSVDTKEFGLPVLCEGPDHCVRASITGGVYDWTGNDWRETAVLPASPAPPEIFESGLLFRNRTDLMQTEMRVYTMGNNTNQLLLALWKKLAVPHVTFYPARSGSKPAPPPAPHWKIPANFSMYRACSTLRDADLFVMEDHSVLKKVIGEANTLKRSEGDAEGGYHATLFCFMQNCPEAVKIALKFESDGACAPAIGGDYWSMSYNSKPPTWMTFGGGNVLLGLENSATDAVNGNQEAGYGCPIGVWMLPVSRLDAAVAGQIKILAEQKNRLAGIAEKKKQELLAKYDLNHDGVIDAGEREEALDDPHFIESQLDMIPASENGWLTAADLAWFDANQNKILEPKEQAGIEIAGHLLAARLLKKFDVNGDDLLDQNEFNDLSQSVFVDEKRPMMFLMDRFPDTNHDGKIDLDELETFLKQRMRQSIRVRRAPGEALSAQAVSDLSRTNDPGHLFKAAVENYWQNPVSVTNRPLFNRRRPPVAGSPTNGTPSDAKP